MLHIIPYKSFVKLYQPQSRNFLVPSFHLRKHASYFGPCLLLCSFPLLNKSIPTLTHFPLFFIMKKEGRTRIITEPWNFLLTTQFVLGIPTNSQDAHLTNANCVPIWSKLSGAPGSIFISSTPLFTNSKNNPGVNPRAIGNGGLTASTISLSFLLLYLFLFHAVSHLCSPLLPPPLLPSVPSPLFSSCCVILILHTLLLWTMNNAWCVRNPQSHAWLPASITELASLLRRWIGERGISHRIRSNFIVCFQH